MIMSSPAIMPSSQKEHYGISTRGHFYFGQLGHYHFGITEIFGRFLGDISDYTD